MTLKFEKGPWVKALIILVVIFIVVLITRYIILREFDFGFSIIIAILVMFIYILVQRVYHYMKNRNAY